MNVVAVCACTVGIAHTWMAKEAIEKECERRGYEFKVEAQGGYGIENELEQDEIDAADVVLLAIAIGIEGDERLTRSAMKVAFLRWIHRLPLRIQQRLLIR